MRSTTRTWSVRVCLARWRSGVALPTVGKPLGYTQVQTTARYAHLARDTLGLHLRAMPDRNSLSRPMSGRRPPTRAR